MNDTVVMLLVKTGLFFANCDGVYDETEKKFIENFLSELDNNGYSVSDETRELAVKALDSKRHGYILCLEAKESMSCLYFTRHRAFPGISGTKR